VAVEISIVVPLYNEADNVDPLVDELVRVFGDVTTPWHVVLVDDGSRDATWDRVRSRAALDPRVRGLRHVENRGQSAAVWTGLTGTSAALLCTLDGDLQNDPSELPRMLGMLGTDLDFVCGHRVARQDNWVRKVSSRVARWARKAALGHDFADTGCALRAFKREALDGVFCFNGLHRFLPILVAGNGSRCREVPVRHRPRVTGVSKYGVWNRLGRGIFDLVGVAWYQRRRIRRVGIEATGPAPTRPSGGT